MRRTLAVLALAALTACQSAPSPLPVPERTAGLDVQVVTSPGGVTAWLVSESFVPIVAMEIAWPGGAVAEPAGKDGAGWMLGYMMNEGAGALDTTAYGARMQDLNMSFACGVMTDWTTCSLSTLKETADESFEMARLAFAELRLDNEPLERARRELTVALKQGDANPRIVASIAMNEALIPGHAYARHASPATVAAVTRQDVQQLKQQLMTRDGVMVVVVGDITADELKPRLDQIFGNLPLTSTSTSPVVPDAVAKPAPVDPIVTQLPQPQTLVLFSGPGIRRDDPDFFAAYIVNYILGGGGFSSRLTDDIREKRGLTYGIGTELRIQPHFWRWMGSSSTMNDKAHEVVQRVRENIARLGEEGPTEQELADAKAYLTGAFPLAFDSNAKIARNLLGFRQDGLDAGYVHERNAHFEAVTLDDVKRVSAAYMKPENFTFVLAGEPTTD